ncbi:MAG: ferrous iron transporter B [Oscillospiraceae bacterium]|jgi:ferrous iron transport protein B|nr:ferrous iron transporter B [Oscillospiraceae bacterium]
MEIKIALAGNPNSGKTTLFNALTGANQFVGNWPGVTVEKKEGKLKKESDVTIIDLPGIYSLSPYTLEEVVARNYLVGERPDAILNIVDATNIERNLYLTTQLVELGIPVVIALNMMDVVRKNGDKIDVPALSRKIGCKVVEISALKSEGIAEAAEAAIAAAGAKKTAMRHIFSGAVEHALAHIEEAVVHEMPAEQQRWYAIKIFERDERVVKQFALGAKLRAHVEKDIAAVEEEYDDDAESIITNDRYNYISHILQNCYVKKNIGKETRSDKIDRVVTNRFLALPIFALIMVLVYYISVTTVGTWATDWANDGLFGEGWHLLGIGTSAYEESYEQYAQAQIWTPATVRTLHSAQEADVLGAEELLTAITDADPAAFEEAYDAYGQNLREAGYEISLDLREAPVPSDYGIWIPGVPILVERGLQAIHCAPWLQRLILDGVIAGVGAVLGFVPQMIVLFLFLSILESCGYMARIAFVMDRLFRRFGLSGKSFIPMLIGTGCSVPGIMASRTIENLRDRRMTIITTSFIPCGAKLPVIAMISGALFRNAWWVAPSAYFIGIAAVVLSGIILKKTKIFAGDPSPFVMELPSYHLPTIGNVMRPTWDRAWSFIKKAGTLILLSSICIWAGSVCGFADGKFVFSLSLELEQSLLGKAGNALKWLFAPLGFGNAKATVASLMGLLAKEEIVSVFGVLDFEGMTKLAAFSFLIFNLLCAPCVAAMGAIRREMNSAKWTWFAIGYQCLFAYGISLIVYQFGSAFGGNMQFIGLTAAVLALFVLGYMLLRRDSKTLKANK